MNKETYNKITELLHKKEEIEDNIRLIDNNPCVIHVEDFDWIDMDKQLVNVVKKEFIKRLNNINNQLKELNFEVD